MATEAKLLIVQFLKWIDARPRNRADVQEAWQSTCPLTCAWEDAVSDDLVAAGPEGHLVVTDKGRAVMAAAEPAVAIVEDRRKVEDQSKIEDARNLDDERRAAEESRRPLPLQEDGSYMYRIWVADLDSPSYFVATAAVELGYFKREGVDVEFVYNTREGPALMREGKLDFIGGPAFVALRAFPEWHGVKLLCALAQHTYWFLAVRRDLDVQRGDLAALKGLRISAAMSDPAKLLQYMLIEAGLDLARDNIRLVPPPPSYGDKGFMARNGIDAITQGQADAYWGNGMRVALGEKLGIAKLHLDLRRGDGPPGARYYSFPALTARASLVKEHPEIAAGAIRAVRSAQKALRADPSLATGIGEKLFPADEAELIAPLIARDAPFYDAVITREAVDGLMKFTKGFGLIPDAVPYETLVATEFSALWTQ